MEETILKWVKDIIGKFQNMASEATDILCLDLHFDAFGNELAIWSHFVTPIQNITKPVAYSICVFFFLKAICKMKEKQERINPEQFFWLIFKGVISKSIIDFMPTLMEMIYRTVCRWIIKVGELNRGATPCSICSGTGLVDSVTCETCSGVGSVGGSSSLTALSNKLVDILKDAGFFEMIGYAITLLVPLLACWIITFVIKAIAYGRMVELIILFCVMPIPCAFILEEEGHFNITRGFIFDFAGVCLQGFFMVVTCSMFPYIVDLVLNAGTPSGESATGLAGALLLSSIVLFTTVTKSGSLAKKVLHLGV